MVEIKNELYQTKSDLSLLQSLIDFCNQNKGTKGDFIDNFCEHVT